MSKPLAPIAGIPKVDVLDENGNRLLTGYYIYHQSILTCFSGELGEDDVHHYVAYSEFADWNMPRALKIVEITPPHRIEVHND